MNLYWMLPAAMAGVLIPKVVTALVLPSETSTLARWTHLLPAATLGAFTALEASAWLGAAPRPAPAWAFLALALVLAVAVRHTLVVLLVAAAAAITLKLVGLL